ncbi:MAG: YceI family protein [Gemmatimonadales bacterium]
MNSVKAIGRIGGWVLGLALVAGSGRAQTVAAGIVRDGKLSFDGRATVGDFVGVTSTIRGRLSGGDLGQVTGFVEAPVKTLITGNGRRDRDLNKSMESDQYPLLRFDLETVRVDDASRADSTAVTIGGTFTIHGVTHAVSIPAVVALTADAVRVRATTPLNLKDYRIGSLSKMLGILKMHPDIVVHIDLTFSQDGTTEPPPFPATNTPAPSSAASDPRPDRS